MARKAKRQVVHAYITAKRTLCGKPITKDTNIANWNVNVTCRTCKRMLMKNNLPLHRSKW